MKKIILFVALVALQSACAYVEKSKNVVGTEKYKVELINCDGTIGRMWISSGKVLSEKAYDGYYFNDDATGHLIEVTGTLVITRLTEEDIESMFTMKQN